MSNIQIISAPTINVYISSTINSFTAEKRFDKSLTIGELKGRLELITGASSGSMILDVFNEQDELICALTNDEALLGSFPIEDKYRIHVFDSEKQVGEFEDLSKVEKFELTEDEYTKRDDSVRSFLMKNKLGKYNAEEQARIDKEKLDAQLEEETKAKSMTVGDRCEAKIQGEASRRGVVCYVGKTEFKPGFWIGIRYDEPFGKNDGSINGKRYFDAPMKYGSFVRPSNVEVGDFPELVDEMDEI